MAKRIQRLNRLANDIVAPIVEPLGYRVSTPEVGELGIIMSSILRDLDHADIVVANLTGNNPNVLYELGIRHGLGKPTVIVFWAPWCTVCGAESGTISSLRSYYRDRVNVVSVALGYTKRAEVQKFIDDHKVDYPVLLGHRGITQAYRIEAYPTLYILDSKGQITHSTTGFTTLPGLVWRLFWVS